MADSFLEFAISRFQDKEQVTDIGPRGLRGRYFYSDFCNRWLRSFVYSNGTAAERIDWNIINVGLIFSCGKDAQNGLYLLTSTGWTYKIVRQ